MDKRKIVSVKNADMRVVSQYEENINIFASIWKSNWQKIGAGVWEITLEPFALFSYKLRPNSTEADSFIRFTGLLISPLLFAASGCSLIVTTLVSTYLYLKKFIEDNCRDENATRKLQK